MKTQQQHMQKASEMGVLQYFSRRGEYNDTRIKRIEEKIDSLVDRVDALEDNHLRHIETQLASLSKVVDRLQEKLDHAD